MLNFSSIPFYPSPPPPPGMYCISKWCFSFLWKKAQQHGARLSPSPLTFFTPPEYYIYRRVLSMLRSSTYSSLKSRYIRLWMRSSQVWMKSSRVVRTSDCQCQSRNSPGFNTSDAPTQWIWVAADKAVLNKVLQKSLKKTEKITKAVS